MKTPAKYRNILPTQEEINFYEREDELARKAKLAKVENRNYKNRINELRFNERADLSEIKLHTNDSLISVLTITDSLDGKVRKVKTNTENDLFTTLTAESEKDLTADSKKAA